MKQSMQQPANIKSFQALAATLTGSTSDVPMFDTEEPVDYSSVAAEYKRATGHVQPEGFSMKIRSAACTILPSVGQAICIRNWHQGEKFTLKPLFVMVPSAGHLAAAATTGKPCCRSQSFKVFTRVPHRAVPGMLVDRLRRNQEHVLLTIYKSPYGARFQVHDLEGNAEALTDTVSFYGMTEYQRKVLGEFLEYDVTDHRVDMKFTLYKALPLGTFAAIEQLVAQELSAKADDVPKTMRETMAAMLMKACINGGHNPFRGVRDPNYIPHANELQVEDFAPRGTAVTDEEEEAEANTEFQDLVNSDAESQPEEPIEEELQPEEPIEEELQPEEPVEDEQDIPSIPQDDFAASRYMNESPAEEVTAEELALP